MKTKTLPKNVLAFRYKAGMPSETEALQLQVHNLILTFGRETVLAVLGQSYGLQPKARRKIAKAG